MLDSGNNGSQRRPSASANELLTDPSLKAKVVEATAGTVLFKPDAPAQNLYFILSGQVRVYQIGPDESARLLEILGPGDWCGVAALAGAETCGAQAVAVSAATVSEVSADRWLAVLAEHPSVATEWVGQLAAKLQQAHEDSARLVFDDCNSRLIKTLLHFSQTAAATVHPEGVVLRITHQQLAQAVGAARETVSLALTQLRQQNLLRTGRNQLFFDPQVLERFCRREDVTSGQVA